MQNNTHHSTLGWFFFFFYRIYILHFHDSHQSGLLFPFQQSPFLRHHKIPINEQSCRQKNKLLQKLYMIKQLERKHQSCTSRRSKVTSWSSTFETFSLLPNSKVGKTFSVTANHGITDVNPLAVTWSPIQWNSSPPTENVTFVLKQHNLWNIINLA